MKTLSSALYICVIHVRHATLLAMLALVACSPTTSMVQQATATISQATATILQVTATVPQITATKSQTTEEAVGVEVTQESAPFLLSEPGSYFAGTRNYSFVDESRNGRVIRITIWYPALEQTDANGKLIRRDAAPDMSGSPYPLILTGHHSGDLLFESHLSSHGFVMVIVRFPDLDYNDYWDFGVIDHPRDMLFALDQIASNPAEGLEGAIDTDHAGVAGYSWDGFFSLALSGVRIDPKYYLAYCEQAPAMEPAFSTWYREYTCTLAKKWEEFAAHVGDELTVSEDGLWQPVTDERIHAVMPMAPDGAWLYGERGLAMVNRPVFIIAATEDQLTPYQIEPVYIFKHLGSPERFLVSFVDKGHMMVFESEQAKRMNHFATAFFGYYLQGREDYAEYFLEDFVAQFDDLAWGIYKK
jgi:predicted dienelactone hydrolase